jgi:hypothetical protein
LLTATAMLGDRPGLLVLEMAVVEIVHVPLVSNIEIAASRPVLIRLIRL